MGNATSGYGLNWTGGIATSGAMYTSIYKNCTIGSAGGKGDTAVQVTMSCAHQNSIYSGTNRVYPRSIKASWLIRH